MFKFPTLSILIFTDLELISDLKSARKRNLISSLRRQIFIALIFYNLKIDVI